MEPIMTITPSSIPRRRPTAPATLTRRRLLCGVSLALLATTNTAVGQNDAPDDHDPSSPPIRVYILMGQSNMVGFGRIGPAEAEGTLEYLVKTKGERQDLIDDSGDWRVREDVWCVQVTAGNRRGWLEPGFGARANLIGPELGFGITVGDRHHEPVLLIKASQGNRSLGWDILPPGSERFEHGGRIYAGYKDNPSSWTEDDPGKPVDWYAGKQYDDFVTDIRKVLDNLSDHTPASDDHPWEIAGFVWWQGHKDQNSAHASRYEANLVRLIASLRQEFDAPKAPFVLATIAFDGWKLAGAGQAVADAQLAVDGESGRHPKHQGNVKTVEVRDHWRDPAVSPTRQGHHYNHNAETYLLVGEALGQAMLDLEPPPKKDTRTFIPVVDEPTYHLLEGYDPKWRDQIRDGVEMARSFWGSYGPAHVFVVGAEDGETIPEASREAFLEDYCRWRTRGTGRTTAECRPHATERFIDIAERGESEAYLSWVEEFEQPEAELVFINVHQWYYDEDEIPDPVLRGIHEYTHVFQKGFATMPTWMMEGGAVFSEGWLPWIAGRCDDDFMATRMDRLMDRALTIDDPDLSIADMEDIDTAPANVRKYYRELAYDSGAWAVAFLIHQSPSQSVKTFRDEFFPLITKLGWESAVARYLGIDDKADFYRGFDAFMAAPRKTQMDLLREIQP